MPAPSTIRTRSISGAAWCRDDGPRAGVGPADAPCRRLVTGDGEMLMVMGAFATIGAKSPKNLSIVVIDNRALQRNRHAADAHRPWCRSLRHRRGLQFPIVQTVYAEAELNAAIGPLFKGRASCSATSRSTRQRYPMSIRMRDGAHIKGRFHGESARREGL